MQMKLQSLLVAVLIVLLVFGLVILVLWILKKIGGKLNADVRATVKMFGGTFNISSVGLIGSFLALATLALFAVYLIAALLMKMS